LIARRTLLASAIAGIGAVAASDSKACTLLATQKPVAFRSGLCESRIRQFVDFANVASAKSNDEIETWHEQTGISPDYVGEYGESIKTLRVSDGKVDQKPIKVGEIELLRQLKNKASYAFTLKRHQYFAADEEGCNGLFVHDEYYADTTTAYLAAFENNRFIMFREFPEWYV
jgi:hypothetical protein